MPADHRGRVLIIDDEEDACRNLADILVDRGFLVDWVCEGEAALELVRRGRHDVALLDLMMPGMDGLRLHREIKKIRAGMVTLLATAHVSDATLRDAVVAGAWRVVPKPVSLPGLLGPGRRGAGPAVDAGR